MKFSAGPGRDEEVFEIVERVYAEDETVMELLGIAKKWRSKALMREARIKEVQDGLKKCIEENQVDEML
jgi:hypothetical protein